MNLRIFSSAVFIIVVLMTGSAAYCSADQIEKNDVRVTVEKLGASELTKLFGPIDAQETAKLLKGLRISIENNSDRNCAVDFNSISCPAMRREIVAQILKEPIFSQALIKAGLKGVGVATVVAFCIAVVCTFGIVLIPPICIVVAYKCLIGVGIPVGVLVTLGHAITKYFNNSDIERRVFAEIGSMGNALKKQIRAGRCTKSHLFVNPADIREGLKFVIECAGGEEIEFDFDLGDD